MVDGDEAWLDQIEAVEEPGYLVCGPDPVGEGTRLVVDVECRVLLRVGVQCLGDREVVFAQHSRAACMCHTGRGFPWSGFPGLGQRVRWMVQVMAA